MQRSRNLQRWWQQWTILTCLDSRRPRLASKMQLPEMTRINKSMSMKMMMMNTLRKMFTGALLTVMTNWMKQHTHLVTRHMTLHFLHILMAMWKTLIRPYLKCKHQQVAVLKKHVSSCLVLRVPEDTFLLLALALLTACLSHPLIASLQSLVAKAGRAIEREILFAHLRVPHKPHNNLSQDQSFIEYK